MHRFTRSLIVCSLLLAACSSGTPGDQGPVYPSLRLEDQSSDREIAFMVTNNGELFTDYGVSHTKEMHVIVVRDDLRNFAHLHPEKGSDNIWRVSYSPPSGGTYWVYADFVDTSGEHHVLRLDRTYDMALGPVGVDKEAARTKRVGNYIVTMTPRISPDTASFAYTITDRSGQPVALEDYLGAKGHSVLISEKGEFIHTHAISAESNSPIFVTDIPRGFWRMFTQFQVNGEVITTSFDWEGPRTPDDAKTGGHEHMNH